MSRGCKFFTFFLFILDVICINASFYAANYLRLGGIVSVQYRLLWLYLNFVTLLTFLGMGMYDKKSNIRKFDEVRQVVKSLTIAIVIAFSSATYVYYRAYFSRAVFLYFWGMTSFSISIVHIFFKKFETYLINRGVGVKRVLIIGAGATGQQVRNKIAREILLGYQFIGFLDDKSTEENVLGKIRDLRTMLKFKHVDQVFLTIIDLPKRRQKHLTLLCKKYGISLKLISPIFKILNNVTTTNEFFGIPTMRVKPGPLHGINCLVKRGLDIVFSLATIVILLPVWIIIGFLIKLDSPGPIFYTQTRVGKDGKMFLLYKFRSMHIDADKRLKELQKFNETNGPIFKMARDPRVTRIGRFLRKGSFDEFPQFINVLLGDMSVVGPRPPLPSEVANYDEWHKKRLEIDQGITGLWQISGRSKLSFEEMVLLDILYLENWSLWLDVNIILKTIPTVLQAEGAY